MQSSTSTRVRQHRSLSSEYVMVRGQPLHYCVSRTTPMYDEAIVMVHGLVVSSRYLQPTARLLAPAYRVFTPDLSGSGKSKGYTFLPNLAELADALADWMTAVHLPHAYFLGNSVGCQVLIQLALRHAERVQRLILTAPTTDPRARTLPREVVRWLKNVPYEPPALLGIVLRDFLDMGFRRFIVMLCKSIRDPVEQHLPNIAVPTLVVRGTHDTVISQQWAEEVARILPRGQLIVLPEAAHDLTYNSATALARLVRAPFLTAPVERGNPHPSLLTSSTINLFHSADNAEENTRRSQLERKEPWTAQRNMHSCTHSLNT